MCTVRYGGRLYKRSQTISLATNVFSSSCNEVQKQEIRTHQNKITTLQSKWFEKYRVNTLSEREIEYFECCNNDLIASDVPNDKDTFSLRKDNIYLIDNSTSGMEDEGDASSGLSISDAKAAVNTLRNFFATETG
ncbi:hypothetical protein AVEN_47035-1 [Araneus ventricosus]|uniref:Uncharacterized protein n=1 Tax=Araneus ventricosus TaxID=182803 RepID=A0A4Y2EZL2_ARAVE|nr:hypothetical protein AVEN_47035-1 [Araneus ventricosus]